MGVYITQLSEVLETIELDGLDLAMCRGSSLNCLEVSESPQASSQDTTGQALRPRTGRAGEHKSSCRILFSIDIMRNRLEGSGCVRELGRSPVRAGSLFWLYSVESLSPASSSIQGTRGQAPVKAFMDC